VFQNQQVERYAANNVYAFTRGNLFVIMNNQGNDAPAYLTTTITCVLSCWMMFCIFFSPSTIFDRAFVSLPQLPSLL
jgi:hypothetical protein